MTLRIIYDNVEPVSPQVQALIGIENFGNLIFRRRTLLDWFKVMVEASGLEPLIELNSSSEWARLDARLRNGEFSEDLFLVCPSRIVSGDNIKAVALFLRQARHAPGNLFLEARNSHDRSGWTLLSAPLFREYIRKRAEGDLATFLEQHEHEFVSLGERLALVDLNDEVALLRFLAGGFDVRFFNSILHDEYTVTKRSTDKAKLEREYRLYGLLPPSMQMFFVQPFDFTSDADAASYRMERLNIPDMALQWVHGALDEAEFGRFLDRAFHFLSVRSHRQASREEAEVSIQSLYVEKVKERVGRLTTLPDYRVIETLLANVCGTVEALSDRYFSLFERSRRRLPRDRLVIGHGDFCFSNILYGKASQSMKLIDPRGASDSADLYMEPYYDLAKLSHSVMGSYDLINQDMFELQVGEDMKLRLLLDRPPPPWAKAMFAQRLEQSGFELPLVRLCEASLFISMLPLHIDRPRKVLGFAINAADILDEIEPLL